MPIMSAVVVLLEEAVVGAELVDDGAAAAPLDGVAVEPHAANPIGSAAAKATRTVARRAVLVRAFMVGSYFRTGVCRCDLHLVFGLGVGLDCLEGIGFSSRDDDGDLLDAA
jgi:hypothetical protein